jgi:hypothetical protein
MGGEIGKLERIVVGDVLLDGCTVGACDGSDNGIS